MKKKEINRVYYCPTYRVKVHFRTGPAEGIKKFCGGLDEDEFTCGGCYQITKTNGDGSREKEFLVWIEDKTDHHHMVHETAHLVQHVFGYMGVTYDNTNKEAIAYYQEYWVRKFWHVMSKNVKYTSKAKDHKNDKSKGEKSGRGQKTGTK